MKITETFITALRALKANKARSALTVLGIVIGVFSVVSLVSLVQGVTNFITDQFNAIGSNLIIVAPGRFSFARDPAIAFSNNKLSEKDVSEIEAHAQDFIVAITPNIRLSKTVTYKQNNFLAELIGVNASFLDIVNFEVAKGISFTKADVDSAARVAVIGPQVAKNLFGNTSPLEKTIKIADVNFKVIGVFEGKGPHTDSQVIVPYTAIKRSLDVEQLSGLSIKAKPGVDIDEAMSQIELIMLSNHKEDEFTVLSQRDILNSFQNILGMLSMALGAIAGISLLVGGIGIMNIMLVSVNERISEIGLRKAVGATSRDIATQFIFESSLLSVMGGILGLLLGFGATYAAKSYIRAEIPLWAIVVSLGFSIVVGVLFGTYPALIASKKDAVESLRYEI